MEETNKNMQFYRYEAVSYADIDHDGEFVSPRYPNPKIELRTYNLHKETPKGYWIGYGYYRPDMLRGNSRWVSKTGLKRYAYPTKKEAMWNYIKRTEKRVKILKAQLRTTEVALERAKALQKHEKEFS